ncbi:MAG: hypothetical protein EB084_26020, partial [Proteobacteria bacterium]|nr:hypothetical protein [Pseudomonadota bacterium]
MRRLLVLVLSLVLVSTRCAACAPAAGGASTAPRGTATLEAKVRARLAASRGRLVAGIAIVHVEGGERLFIDAERPYPLASVFKLPVLVEVGRRLQAGTMKLDDLLTVREEM